MTTDTHPADEREVSQAHKDAWEELGPLIFHGDLTGPEALARFEAKIRDEYASDAGQAEPVDDGLREALQTASGMLIRHHQWHVQNRTPDPEHGFIPADEYADSSLYEQTADAIDKIDAALASHPDAEREVAGLDLLQLLADIELHFKTDRVFWTSREKMHPHGVVLLDELQANVSAAINALGKAPTTPPDTAAPQEERNYALETHDKWQREQQARGDGK